MSVTLAVLAIIAALTAVTYACWPSLFHGPAPEESLRRPSPRPLIRPAAPSDSRPPPASVWQLPDAAVDPPTWPLRRDERDLFDELVYVHDFLSPNVQPLSREEQQ